MPNWTIYSIGDSEFLEQILISLVMVTGSDDFMKAASISALLSIIFIGFSSMMNKGREFDLSSVLVGWILFSIMFIPRSTVLIEDTVDGSVRVVDSVPLGVAASGGIISQLGYGLTNIFEQAYSHTAGHMGNGYFTESLVVLNSIRTKAFNAEVFKMMEESTGWNIYDSFYNYMKDCTAKGQVTGNKKNVAMAENFFTFMKNDSTLFHTELIQNGTRRTVSCNAAYGEIMAALNAGLASPKVHKAINDTSGFKDRLLVGATNEMGQPYSLMNNVQSSLNMLTDGATTAQDYVKLSLLEPIYMQALQGYYMNMQDMTSALMINQAVQQRNTQWASEQSMFMTSLRPLVAFFEAFIFAILPILGVMLIAGRFGFSLAGKYLMVLIWVQLWFPLLSIVNLFITVAATRELRQFTDGITSVFALNKSTDILQNWIGVGGMLAGYTPVLALFVIGGSVITLNSIASKISGSDNVNEKMASPDLTNAPNLMEQQAKHVNSQSGGRMFSGASSSLGSFAVGQDLSQIASSASSKSEQASDAFNHSLSRAWTDAVASNRSTAFSQAIGHTIMGSKSSQWSSIQNQASSIQKTFGLTEEQTEAVAGHIATNASIGVEPGQIVNGLVNMVNSFIGGKDNSANKSHTNSNNSNSKLPVSPSASLSFGSQDKSQVATKEDFSDVMSMTQSIQGSKTESSTLTNNLADVVSRQSGTTDSSILGDAASRSLANTASGLVTANKQFNEASQHADKFSHASPVDKAAFGQTMINNTNAARHLEDAYTMMPKAVKEATINRAAQLNQALGIPRQNARYIAMAEAMLNRSNYNGDNASYSNGVMAVSKSIESGFGINSSVANAPASAYANSNLSTPSSDFNTLKNRVTPATTAIGLPESNDRRDDIEGIINAHEPIMETVDPNRTSGYSSNTGSGNHVENYVKQNNTNLAGIHNANQSKINGEMLEKLDDRIIASNGDITEASRFYGGSKNLSNLANMMGNTIGTSVSNVLETLPTLLSKGPEAAAEAYNQLPDYFAKKDNERINMAKEWGLTDKQAQYLASTYTGSHFNENDAKKAMINEIGPSPKQQQVGEHIADWINKASYGGETAGAYLTHIAMRNQLMNSENSDFFGNAPSSNSMAFMSMPVEGARISSEFNPERVHPIDGVVRPHNGVDFAASSGTPITAAMAGTVTYNGYQKGYGNIMILDHGNGFETRYAHNSWNNKDLKVGSQVKEGDLIAKVGSTGASTGPHLHFETRFNGEPIDPLPYLAKK